MDPENSNIIEKKILEILDASDLEYATVTEVRNSASEELKIDLSEPDLKKFVRNIVDNYLEQQHLKAEKVNNNEKDDEMEEEEEYDGAGNLIICRLSAKRMVTLGEFNGKTLVSIREYYKKDGKERPSTKGISLTVEQWSNFSKSVPTIDKAIKKLEGR